MPAEFNHALLLLARQYRERSQTQVAKAAGLNQGHYSRIENGLLPEGPSDENAERIAGALSFPASFFYQSDDVTGLPLSVHPMHRKKMSVGEKALRRVHAELNIRLIHIRRFLEAVETDAELPLPWIDVDEGGGPREIARKIRAAWLVPPGPIANLTDLAERAGVYVIWCRFGAPIDGVTMRVRDLPTCVFLNADAPADRMRFSLAHELGHIIMHRVPTDEIEDEANMFAAELLVPAKDLRHDLIGRRLTIQTLARLKSKWHVSMQFLLYQSEAQGLIRRTQAQYLWKKISRMGWRTREPSETDFEHEDPRLFPAIIDLHRDSLGYDVDDLVGLLHMEAPELRLLYGLQDTHNEHPFLRVIK